MNSFRELAKRLQSPESLITEIADDSPYRRDASDITGQPAAVLLAQSTGDVVAALRFCHAREIPITARGAGTGLSGGCVPSTGSLVLSTERMTSLEINSKKKLAICGPGVITRDLMEAASKHGLTYPPDPASYAESTIGGNIAECAGGLRCKRYGVTKDYVLGLRAVTASGELLETGLFIDDAGFAIGDLLIGSEGTLAILTEIAVRLIDQPPLGTTLLLTFNDPRDAAKTVSDITTSGIVPTVLEFLDGDAATCSNQYERFDRLDDAAAILLIETGGESSDAQSEAIRFIAESHNCIQFLTESDPNKADSIWKVRRNLSFAVKAISKLRVSEDVAVPNSKLADLVAYVAMVNKSSPLRINSFGHAGDGNLHVNFLAAEDTPESHRLIEKEIRKLIEKTLSLGGTISAEHGIGLAKRQFISLEFDQPTLAAMKGIKSLFDPSRLLNPEKLFE